MLLSSGIKRASSCVANQQSPQGQTCIANGMQDERRHDPWEGDDDVDVGKMDHARGVVARGDALESFDPVLLERTVGDELRSDELAKEDSGPPISRAC